MQLIQVCNCITIWPYKEDVIFLSFDSFVICFNIDFSTIVFSSHKLFILQNYKKISTKLQKDINQSTDKVNFDILFEQLVVPSFQMPLLSEYSTDVATAAVQYIWLLWCLYSTNHCEQIILFEIMGKKSK